MFGLLAAGGLYASGAKEWFGLASGSNRVGGCSVSGETCQQVEEADPLDVEPRKQGVEIVGVGRLQLGQQCRQVCAVARLQLGQDGGKLRGQHQQGRCSSCI